MRSGLVRQPRPLLTQETRYGLHAGQGHAGFRLGLCIVVGVRIHVVGEEFARRGSDEFDTRNFYVVGCQEVQIAAQDGAIKLPIDCELIG